MARTPLDCCEFIECNGNEMFLTATESIAEKDQSYHPKKDGGVGQWESLKNIPLQRKPQKKYGLGFSGGDS